jgi:hypothetical protein
MSAMIGSCVSIIHYYHQSPAMKDISTPEKSGLAVTNLLLNALGHSEHLKDLTFRSANH